MTPGDNVPFEITVGVHMPGEKSVDLVVVVLKAPHIAKRAKQIPAAASEYSAGTRKMSDNNSAQIADSCAAVMRPLVARRPTALGELGKPLPPQQNHSDVNAGNASKMAAAVGTSR